jgi:hypothetical protein
MGTATPDGGGKSAPYNVEGRRNRAHVWMKGPKTKTTRLQNPPRKASGHCLRGRPAQSVRPTAAGHCAVGVPWWYSRQRAALLAKGARGNTAAPCQPDKRAGCSPTAQQRAWHVRLSSTSDSAAATHRRRLRLIPSGTYKSDASGACGGRCPTRS